MDPEEESASPHLSKERLKKLFRKQEERLREDERRHIRRCQQCRNGLVEAWLRSLRSRKRGTKKQPPLK
jgi:hypothetical protein